VPNGVRIEQVERIKAFRTGTEIVQLLLARAPYSAPEEDRYASACVASYRPVVRV